MIKYPFHTNPRTKSQQWIADIFLNDNKMQTTCPKCKKQIDVKIDCKKIITCSCTHQFVVELDEEEIVISEPDCLYGFIERCKFDKNGECVNCGEYNSNFDWKD